MAAPTITAVTPSTVWTAGQLVLVTGTDFRSQPEPPPSNGPLPDPLPTMAVTVDGAPAKNVEVLSATMLSCVLPEHEPSPLEATTQTPTPLDLVVTNLDDAGAPIPGETATRAGAIVYARPDLTAEADAGRVDRAFLRMLKRQVVANVVKLGISPDFGDAPFAVTRLAEPPGLVVTGPRCREDVPYWSTQQRPHVPSQLGPGLTDIKARPLTFQLEYSISGYGKNDVQALALAFVTRKVLERSGFLEVQRDKDDPTNGSIRYQMIVPVESEFRDASMPGDSGWHSFDGLMVVIHGVGVEDVAGFPGESIERVGVGAQEEVGLQMSASRRQEESENRDAGSSPAVPLAPPAAAPSRTTKRTESCLRSVALSGRSSSNAPTT